MRARSLLVGDAGIDDLLLTAVFADDLPMTDFLFLWYCYLVHPRAYCEDNVRQAIFSKSVDLQLLMPTFCPIGPD